METVYLSIADIVALHEFIMQKTGFGPAPLRDESALESAAMRAQMAAFYESADLIRQAALLAVGISQAQAFVDGNKRTALIAMDAFLRLNDHAFIGDDLAVTEHLASIAQEIGDRASVMDRFEIWLRANVRSG